ncbi:MAG: hypothetical protein ACYDC1_25605, partial [Limisphaerales bacterium]
TLLGIDPNAGDVTDDRTPELAKVYVQLNTTELRTRPKKSLAEHGTGSSAPDVEPKTESLPAVAAIFDNPRSVFLGAPGSGKSTLFRYLAFCLARHHTSDSGDWLGGLGTEDWKSEPPVPIWVELRRFAAAFREHPPPRRRLR